MRKVSSPLRQSETSGKTSEAGGSEDQAEEPPPSGSKAKPPTQSATSAGGETAGLVGNSLGAQALGGDVRESALDREIFAS